MLFSKLLIANRGEIACRIIKTASTLGIPTVAVYSEADQDSLHVRQSDEAIAIGPASPAQSYLNIETIIGAALKSGTEAIHPGYGFLSENHELAAQCESNGIQFIGPTSDVIRVMASKSAAGEVAKRAGVPTLPGYRSTDQHRQKMISATNEIGYPVLLKSALGGGGRGMRIVNSESDFESALVAAKSESMASFGNDEIVIEKYLPAARHIEVQVVADKHGNCIHLFDRDCSAQRRYQKIIEEAPALGISSNTRSQMLESVIRLAKELKYNNVGTVEFLVQADQFYFMEMNTRLQVEHPVTEQVTNVDLVEWQLRISAGEDLHSFDLPKSTMGHSIEARIYAENPSNGFLPSPGPLKLLHLPKINNTLQVHTGVQQGDSVNEYYDPMIAKLVATGNNRGEAVNRLLRALKETFIIGTEVNVGFLIELLQNESFQTGNFDIKFVESNLHKLLPFQPVAPVEVITAATLLHLNAKQQSYGSQTPDNDGVDLHSPWNVSSGWRLNSKFEFYCTVQLDNIIHNVSVFRNETESFHVQYKSEKADCQIDEVTSQTVKVRVNSTSFTFNYFSIESHIVLFRGSSKYELKFIDLPFTSETLEDQSTILTAPLPGRVTRSQVKLGDSVTKGDCLIVIEAMKMEHQIRTSINGIIKALNFQVGDQVSEGAICVELEPTE